jgi:hypothetical protein
MMNQQQQLDAIQVSIDKAKHAIELGTALERLLENSDFIKVFKKGYMEDEAQRLVVLKTDYNMQDERSQKMIDYGIIGIGQLNSYTSMLLQQAEAMKTALADMEEVKSEIIQGE